VSLPFGPAGWGDPLDRDIADLRADLDAGAVSAEAGQAAYGAAVDPCGVVDADATAARRAEVRSGRMRWPRGDAGDVGGAGDAGATAGEPPGVLTRTGPLGDRLELSTDEAGQRWVRCTCGTVLSRWEQNWRDFALVSAELPGPGHLARVGPGLELRRYCCPGCGRQHAVDIRPAGAPHLHDQRPR
jgi:N-methylhydantoinase B